jgi:hypothetical protein
MGTSVSPWAVADAARLGRHHGVRRSSRAVQVDPIKPTLKAPGTERLKLECEELLSNFGFNFNLRRYNPASHCDFMALPAGRVIHNYACRTKLVLDTGGCKLG